MISVRLWPPRRLIATDRVEIETRNFRTTQQTARRFTGVAPSTQQRCSGGTTFSNKGDEMKTRVKIAAIAALTGFGIVATTPIFAFPSSALEFSQQTYVPSSHPVVQRTVSAGAT